MTSENAERVLYACIPLDRGGSVNRLPLRSSRAGGYWSYLLLRRRDLFVPRILDRDQLVWAAPIPEVAALYISVADLLDPSTIVEFGPITGLIDLRVNRR